MKYTEKEMKTIEQAKSNLLRGNDIESATLILEKVILDGMIIKCGRINILKVAARQIINFIEEYKNKEYLDIVREKVYANEESRRKDELIEKQQKEIERLYKDNNELKRIYKNTAEHLSKIGNTELSDYFYAQIDLVPTFYVGDIIDYYEEYYKQKEIIKELELEIKDLKSKTQIISPLYIKENYISKELIREKIEFYRRGLADCNDPKLKHELRVRIKELEELLGVD